MSLLSVDSVSKGFRMKPLFEDVSFGLKDSEKMGIIGPNGSGKTTLMRIISGLEPPDSGRVVMRGGAVVAYLPQDPTFAEGLSVLDAIFDEANETLRLLHDYEAACHQLEISGGTDEALLERMAELAHRMDAVGGWDREAEAKAVLSKLGIDDTDAHIETLSGGQRKRVALARALILRPDLLILDEPTNHLDADTVAWMEDYLATFTGALLLITHDRYFLDRVTGHILEIDKGTTQRFPGNYTAYLELKEQQLQQQEAETDRRANLVRRELAWLRRGAKARTTKQKARVDRAHALMETPVGQQSRQIELSAVSSRLGKRVVDVEHISKSYDGITLFDDFTYRFTRDDRIGIIGPNGSGKTTLLEIIAGRVQPDSGMVEIGQTAVIGYYDQESRALKDDLRVIDYVKEVAENIRTADGSLITASQMLERFLFAPNVQYTPVGLLSGGERRRLYLLRVLMTAPNVLLLDEPTNDLDIPTLVALENYLDDFGGCLIVASHDRYFLDRTVEHLFRFEGDGTIRSYPGNYSAFLETRAREEAEAAQRRVPARVEQPASRPAKTSEPAGRKDAQPGKLSFKERKELETLESRIARAELRQAELEAALANPPDDYEAINALASELETLLGDLEHDMNRWAELAGREQQGA